MTDGTSGAVDRAGRGARAGLDAGRAGRWSVLRAVVGSIWSRAEGRFVIVVIALWLLTAAVSAFWTPWPLLASDGYRVWAAPGAGHALGTDGVGRDLLSWLMAGSRTELVVVAATVLLTFALGLLVVSALIARNGLARTGAVVAVDALISVPTVLVALVLAIPLEGTLWIVILSCALAYALNLGRICRSQGLLARDSQFALAARAAGASPWRVLTTHVLPQLVPTFVVQLSIAAGTTVLAEAGLTYLGIGVPASVPSWGHSLAASARFINVFPLSVVWPGAVITLAVSALNLLGDVVRDAVDPLSNPALRRALGERELGRVASRRPDGTEAVR